MPFTPYHFGPSLWIGLLFYRYLDFLSFFIASIIIDIEPFYVLFFNINYPLHGFFHTFIGGTFMALLLSLVLYYLKNILDKIHKFLNLYQRNFINILFSCLVGIYLHVLLDSFLYYDIKPLFPFKINPFYKMFSSHMIYLFCSFSFVLGGGFYLFKVLKIRKSNLRL